MSRLPIDEVLPEIVGALRAHCGVVIEAPPGAGKSTRVPPALLDAGLAGGRQVVMLEPRRVAARATAGRIARERGVRLGEEVGYQVRFDRRAGPDTKLLVITEGILTRWLQRDPLLDDVGLVILDEFHERSVHSDLAIAFLREVQQVRDDLKVVVMSATIATAPIAEFLDVPVVKSLGRTFPVEVEYLAQPPEERLEYEAARAARRYVGGADDDGGDILIFLPGRAEIHRCLSALERWAPAEGVACYPLYSALSNEEQDRALAPGGGRRIIVSTNIAETSLTIEGVTLVIDSGQVRTMRSSPASGLNELVLEHVSLASANQRAGRAGRVRAGRALRLWTRAFEHRMAAYDDAELQRVELSPVVQEVVAWSGADPGEFGWFESPPAPALAQAVELLRQLGALEPDDFRTTDVGRRLLDLPLHPRLGRMLIEGERRGCAAQTCAMAAILSERDFVTSVASDAPAGRSDVLIRAELLEDAARGSGQAARRLGLGVHQGGARRVAQVRDQLLKTIGARRPDTGDAVDLLKTLLVAFPDRIAFRREDGAARFVMVGGEALALARESVVRDAEVVVAASIGGRTRARDAVGGVASRGLIRMASQVEMAWLEDVYPRRFDERVVVAFDSERERVMAERQRRFDGIALERQVASVDRHADAAEVTTCLLNHALDDVVAAFGLGTDDAQFLLRWECARRWFPDADFPRLMLDARRGDPAQPIWEQVCWGKRSLGQLRAMNLGAQLSAYLNREQRRLLDEELPPRLEVPSGSQIRLEYRLEGPPVLAVRIQEVFGWLDSPRLARGQVAVLLHLLAPNYRPQQVTDDLAGFWERTYPQVRKELRARYAKHPWPEDPLQARAIRK
ncbi:ATP-dependent helicase HrpB [Lujinxingia litoralis]|uniref:ATP-dependent helicase HrpB n=1 Tax=Lujinxingia litoralis TaxID=2211119 RepID=A0A328C8H1_9DELT|nr:ATP-dependent helicase HrpB [Lujinxingia litoralis]RAL24907.1 ATP-dependent helicase HrpB [Lujinxingia litoralis]